MPLVCHFIVRFNQRQREMKMPGLDAGASLLECFLGGGGWSTAGLKHKGYAAQGLGVCLWVNAEAGPGLLCVLCMLLLFSGWVMSDSATTWTAARQASLSRPISWGLLKLISIESLMLSNHLILCPPLLLLPSVFPSIRVFSSESALHIR